MNFDVELLEITKDNLAEAQFVAANFINKKLQNRIFFNVIGAEAVILYLSKLGVDVSKLSNIHSIKRIVEKIDIADIILDNVYIDVRVAFDDSGVFIPKSHFDLSIVPDIYVVLKYDNNFERINLIGYFEPNDVQLHIANDQYYFVSAEQFRSPIDMIDYVNGSTKKTEKNLSQEEILKGRELSISVADHDISEEDFNKFIHLLYESKILRDSVLEYDNFETLASNVAAALRINKKEMSNNSNTVVDLDDFIDMDNNESENQTNENQGNRSDSAESTYDANGDDLLDDEKSQDQNDSSVLEKAGEIVSDITEAEAIAAEGAAAVAGTAAATNIVPGTVSDEAAELAAVAGEDIFESSNSADLPEINEDFGISEDVSADANIFDEDISLNDLSEEGVMAEEIESDPEAKSEDVLSEFDADEQKAQQQVEESNDISVDLGDDISNLNDFEEDMEQHASDDFLKESDMDFEEFNDDFVVSEALGNEIDIEKSENLSDFTETDTDLAEKTEILSDDDNFENNIDADDISLDMTADISEESVTSDISLNQEEPTVSHEIETSDVIDTDAPVQDVQDDLLVSEFISEAPNDAELHELDLNLDDDLHIASNSEKTDSDEIESREDSDENFMNLEELDADSIGMEAPVIVPPNVSEANYDSEVHDFDQLSVEPAEKTVENDDSELINLDDLTDLSDLDSKIDNENNNVEINFNQDDQLTDFDEIPTEFNNGNAENSFEKIELDSDFITPVNTVSENSVVISNKNITPGEIIIDINKDANQPEFSVENQHLEELYNNVNISEDNAGLNNDVRIVNNQGKSIPIAIGIGGLAILVILTGIIIFAASKFMNPEQNNNGNEQFADPNIQNNMGGDVPNFNPDNGNTAMNGNNDFNRPERNNFQNVQSAPQTQNNNDLKQIPATAFLSVSKLSWEVPDYIAQDSNFKQYFQSSGKSLKAALSSDLLLATDYTYSDQIRVSITFDRSGAFQQSKILLSSGSSQVDNIVLQSVNQTLKVLRAPNSLGNDQSTTVILKIYL